MDADLATFERAAEAQPPWPAPLMLPPLPPPEREDLVELQQGDVSADRTEAFAATAAGAKGAVDVAIGDGLAAMQRGDRLIRLGFSCLGDYAREILGIAERTAQSMAHLSRELRSRPLLRAAVMEGKVRVRKAQTVLPVAVGSGEAEWVEAAKSLSVGTLEVLVRAARARCGEDDEEWTRFRARLPPEDRATLDEALEVAGKVLGSGATRAEELEAMAQEYIAEHPEEAGQDDGPLSATFSRQEEVRLRLEAQLEVETQQWFMLPVPPDLFVPEAAFDDAASPEEIDAQIRRLATMRASWDDALGPTALAVKESGIYRSLGFASFRHYSAERLGLAERTVEQRVAVERRMWEVPELREALHRRLLSYEQVRLLSHLPAADIPAWIPRAEGLTCVELRRQLSVREEAQLRAAGSFAAPVPKRIALTLSAAFRAVRAVENPCWADGKCLVAIAKHFLEVWKPLVKRRRTRSQRVRERDLGRCQVPMCSRRAAHAHHVKLRSHLGPHTEDNLVGVCSCHHLRGIHGGHVRVSGTAPSGLVWELGGKILDGAGALGEAGMVGVNVDHKPSTRGRLGSRGGRPGRPRSDTGAAPPDAGVRWARGRFGPTSGVDKLDSSRPGPGR